MKAGFLGIPFCLVSGVGQFQRFEAASEIHAETLLLTGRPREQLVEGGSEDGREF